MSRRAYLEREPEAGHLLRLCHATPEGGASYGPYSAPKDWKRLHVRLVDMPRLREYLGGRLEQGRGQSRQKATSGSPSWRPTLVMIVSLRTERGDGHVRLVHFEHRRKKDSLIPALLTSLPFVAQGLSSVRYKKELGLATTKLMPTDGLSFGRDGVAAPRTAYRWMSCPPIEWPASTSSETEGNHRSLEKCCVRASNASNVETVGLSAGYWHARPSPH